jgi:hypothetical protein
MLQYSDPSISSPERLFEIEFVKFGSFNHPASHRRATVLAATRKDALRILKRAVPRSDRHRVVSEAMLLKAAA